MTKKRLSLSTHYVLQMCFCTYDIQVYNFYYRFSFKMDKSALPVRNFTTSLKTTKTHICKTHKSWKNAEPKSVRNINKPKFPTILGECSNQQDDSGKITYKKFGFNVANAGVSPFASDEKRLSAKLTILVNDITIAMKKLEYGSY